MYVRGQWQLILLRQQKGEDNMVKLIGFIIVGAIVVYLFGNFPEEMLIATGLAVVGAIATFISNRS